MRFVSLVSGTVGRARRGVSRVMSYMGRPQAGEDATPAEVARALRQLGVRLDTLEASAPGEGTEFEAVVGTGGAVVFLAHGYGGPVRWWVTDWMAPLGGAGPTAAPVLVHSGASTNNTLALKSYVAGRAIVRIEPARVGVQVE